MKLKPILLTICWLTAVIIAWRSGPWQHLPEESSSGGMPASHNKNFHMHDPLHAGGKVRMSGQFHLELVSRVDGKHQIWISNAFRQEISPAGFQGKLIITSINGEVTEEVPLVQVPHGRELIANSKELSGQVTLKVNGQLGNVKKFENVTFFWDYNQKNQLNKPPLGLDPMVPRNSQNQPTKEKIALGKSLFFDPLLSVDGSISCASCHKPKYAFAEPVSIAKGIDNRLGLRNTPSLLNSAYFQTFFWDGRSHSLEEQATHPMLDHVEMGFKDETTFVKRLQKKYASKFEQVMKKPISLKLVADAIACYERTLFSGDSNFDRFEAGDKNALNDGAQRGRSLFYGKANCGDCHIPPLLTDSNFHNLGVGWSENALSDLGRFNITQKKDDRGAFKTPSLRDVARTAPYMHDGSIATLKDVLEFYNKGCQHNPTIDPGIEPLNLTEQDQDDIIEFLKSLNGRFEE